MALYGVLLFWIFVAQFAISIRGQSGCDPASYFRCHDGTCISLGKTCNGINDCAEREDESEEANCGTGGGSCQGRNSHVAFLNGYPCRGVCRGHTCRASRKSCVCDDECGWSCINKAGLCTDDPPDVPHSVRQDHMRVIRDLSVEKLPEGLPYIFGDFVRYVCEPGWRLVGPPPRCTGRKKWSNEIPECIDETCREPPPVVRGGSVRHYLRHTQGRDTAVATAEWNDVAVYECGPGLRLLGEPPKCQEGGTWSDHTLKCIVGCPHAQSARSASGRECSDECELTFDCGPGQECYCDGKCGRSCVNTSIDCGPAPEIGNTVLNYTGEGIERRARYECGEGYYLAGGRLSLKCTGSGTWEGEAPQCEPVFCGSPFASIVQMGGEVYRIDGFHYGAEATFRCRSNYNMLGSERRICQGNGQWSGRLTICDRQDEAERCPHPGIPINGRLTGYDFSVNATVRFTCDSGYMMKGHDVQKCLYFKEWSGDGAPLCVDPRHPHTANDVIATLSRALANMPDQQSFLGRSISEGDTSRPHEIYFVFDVSESVLKQDEDLKYEVEFAKRLVRRMVGFEGKVKYAIMVFASENVTAMDITKNDNPDITVVLETLDQVYTNATYGQYRTDTRSGTATSLALDKLDGMMAGMDNNKTADEKGKKHVFLFTDGQHTEGGDPVKKRKFIESQFRPNIEFYSVTACRKCDKVAYDELYGLSSNHGKNYIFIKDFYQLSKYLDEVTNVTLDFSKCGQAGDVGSIKEQVFLGRVVRGDDANADEAWPWQALITGKKKSAKETLDDIYGGGSLLNKNWVLTAAHVLARVVPTSRTTNIVVSLGIFERPTEKKKLLKSVKMFLVGQYFQHSGFNHETFQNDIALIKLGSKLDDKMKVISQTHNGVNYGYYIRPVCLPCTGSCLRQGQLVDKSGNSLINDNMSEEQKCQVEEDLLLTRTAKVVVTGFGHIVATPNRVNRRNIVPSVKLQQGLLRIEPRDWCNKKIQDLHGDSGVQNIGDDFFCCTSALDDRIVDSCQGDSGGPVVREVRDAKTGESCWLQIGLVSHAKKGCGMSNQSPGFYIKVSKYVTWIQDIIGEDDAAQVNATTEAPAVGGP